MKIDDRTQYMNRRKTYTGEEAPPERRQPSY